jgi:hypothetical protein
VCVAPAVGFAVGLGPGVPVPIVSVVVAITVPVVVLAEIRPVLPMAAVLGIVKGTLNDPVAEAVKVVTTPPL